MAVSIPRRHKRAKAITVSNHRSTWPTAPGCDTRGRQGQAATLGRRRHHRPQISHAIRLGEVSIMSENVAIPTMPIQILKEPRENYVRNCWAHNIQPGSRTCPASPHGGNCIIRTPTRRRHAEAKLLMLQNPHRSQPHTPRHLQDLAAAPIDANKLSQHSPSSGSSAK